jgi:hypothetical protein
MEYDAGFSLTRQTTTGGWADTPSRPFYSLASMTPATHVRCLAPDMAG